MLAPVAAALSRAVDRGRLTQARADEILARITERVAKLIQKVPKQR
jgi:3-hydroxyacyl-CoA dehydrogenase